MKKKLLFLLFLPVIGFSQATRTSVQNGNASNPFTWDCFCLPTTTDHVIINHQVAMDVNWAITGGGSITVNSAGKFLQSGMHNLLVDGAGSTYTNYGISAFDKIAYTNGATGLNSGDFSITTGMYTALGTSYDNSGLMDGLDSLLLEGTFDNSGTIYTGNFLNTGDFSNTGLIAADSAGNTGTFISTGGYMSFNAFGNSGTFSMTTFGWMEVVHDWYNIGDFTLGAGLQIYAREDFFNIDSLSGQAHLINDGTIEVTNNFYNSYLVSGGGNFCVGNESYNSGSMNGTFDFCDNSGQDFDVNVGSIGPDVAFCQPGCFVEVKENDFVQIKIYPNPTDGNITLESTMEIMEYRILSITGEILIAESYTGQSIKLNKLSPGTYLLQVLSPEVEKVFPIILN